MLILLYAVVGVLVALLTALMALTPKKTAMSFFELRRLKELGDTKAGDMLEREELLARFVRLRAPLRMVLFTVLALLLVHIFGWTAGAVAALLVGVLHEPIARISAVRSFVNALFARYEKKVFSLSRKYKKVFVLLTGKVAQKDTHPLPASAEEIAHIIESSHIFSAEDTRLLKNALGFRRRLVKDSMTPLDRVVSIPYDELLGPLVLDGLHKTGHTLFPVMKGKDIVGLLDSRNHVAVRDQNSVYVRDVMHTDIVRINQSDTLDEALRALLAAKQQLAVVNGESGAPAGLLSLGDTVRPLVGSKQ